MCIVYVLCIAQVAPKKAGRVLNMAPLHVASREYHAKRKELIDGGANAEEALEGAKLAYRACKRRLGLIA